MYKTILRSSFRAVIGLLIALPISLMANISTEVNASQNMGSLKLLWPTNGYVGLRNLDKYPDQTTHYGIDFWTYQPWNGEVGGGSCGGYQGNAVYSALGGEIIEITNHEVFVYNSTYDITIAYLHMANCSNGSTYIESNLVEGQNIIAGKLLGYQGEYTEHVLGTKILHLHLQMIDGERTDLTSTYNLDPTPYLPVTSLTSGNYYKAVLPEPQNNRFVDSVYFNGNYIYATRGINDDQSIYTKVGSGSWISNGSTVSNVDLTTFQNKVFQTVRSRSGYTYTRTFDINNVWSSWVADTQTGTGDIDSAIFNNKLYQVSRDGNNTVVTRSFDGTTWTSWANESGSGVVDPSIYNFNGRLYQAIRGGNGKVYSRSTADGTFNGSDAQESWSVGTYEGQSAGEISMASIDNKLFQTIRSADGDIYTRYTTGNGSTWSTWILLGTGATRDPDTVGYFVSGTPAGYNLKVSWVGSNDTITAKIFNVIGTPNYNEEYSSIGGTTSGTVKFNGYTGNNQIVIRGGNSGVVNTSTYTKCVAYVSCTGTWTSLGNTN
jgi:hypothetical protein